MTKYSKLEVLDRLKSLSGWKLEDGEIRKRYEFSSFSDAMRFVNQVAKEAERADHHPDIFINYRKVTLALSTHDEGGITAKDFGLAERIENEIVAK